MSAVLLDTHALVWLLEGDRKLGRRSRRLADTAARDDTLLVSAFSFWEAAMLARQGRRTLTQPARAWRESALRVGIKEIPVTGDIGILAAELDGFHADPADRIIAGTAIVRSATLVTADTRILEWKGQLDRHDARR